MVLRRELSTLLDAERVICPVDEGSPYNADTSGSWRGLRGRADAVVLPETAEEVAAVLSVCANTGLPLVPRGGGSGVCGGASPLQGGIVCSLERMKKVLELEPGLWRMSVEAGLPTADVHRLALESGLLFPPDPGASEQSQIGGNVATDAGGPHAFKYGSTRHWVTGLQVVLATGEVLRLGSRLRKDVSGYDLSELMIGSEGTLGVITNVSLRLLPKPEVSLCLVAFLPDLKRGCQAVLSTLGSGVVPAALELIDGFALAEVKAAYPGEVGAGSGFALLVEVDGSEAEARASATAVSETLSELASQLDLHEDPTPVWRWREGLSGAIASVKGGKVSEDVVVGPEKLEELILRFYELAERKGLQACVWGHAGDGNVHANLMLDHRDPRAMAAAERVTEGLFELTLELGGSISGEHGIGVVKREALRDQLGDEALELQRRVKHAFDQAGLMNPGKKLPAPLGPPPPLQSPPQAA